MNKNEFEQLKSETNLCRDCDYMLYDPSERYWNFICDAEESVGIDPVSGDPIPHYMYCESCREKNCKGKWFKPRSKDKPTIEQMDEEYTSKRNKEFKTALIVVGIIVCIILLIAWFI